LIYEGELLSANNSDKKAANKNKHAIRKQLHIQLKQLWETERILKRITRDMVIGKSYSTENPIRPYEGLNHIAKQFEKSGHGFVPLVGVGYPNVGVPDVSSICSLDILFLRHEPPGAIVHGGDIDNRLKILFDGLRVPHDGSEIPVPPEHDEQPMYCLLRDDSLISDVKVTTDLLLRPTPSPSDVLLVIEVSMRRSDLISPGTL